MASAFKTKSSSVNDGKSTLASRFNISNPISTCSVSGNLSKRLRISCPKTVIERNPITTLIKN
jgi:hypothetical protein